MTNYEKHFGTPERVEKMTVRRYVDAMIKADMVTLECDGAHVATIKARYFGAWLESEADDG